MVVSRRGSALVARSLPIRVVLAVPLLAMALVRPARAEDPPMCRVINVDFTPGGIAAGAQGPEIAPQIVAWIETPRGDYVDTIYVTQQTGRFGMGNRPGRFDFNSGPAWPYGRRITVFPVWSHKHGATFPQLDFQSGGDNNLSHQFTESSREVHYCRPLLRTESQWDAATCSSAVYTDKGVFGPTSTGYPPRSDVIPTMGTDSPSVLMFKSMNPFDAVSQATPRIGAQALISWPIPTDLAMGDYVMFMEVALEQDFNASYNSSQYPSPTGISYGDYGVPYRGQPSVVYRVPFTVSDVETVAMEDTFVGYGDPAGLDGQVRIPDGTITVNTPNTGAGRLLMTSKGGQTFRIRVDTRPERDYVAPSAPGEMVVTSAQSRDATLRFVAPGDDGLLGVVRGYELHYVVGEGPITDDNFGDANEMLFTADIAAAGDPQVINVKNLLPETRYTVAVRAYDDCHNTGKVTTTTFTTALRQVGEVDACFVATAAYGSLLANDVDMLRHFRDTLLKHSVLGELAVEAYYTFGPPVAGIVGESDLLRATARDVLTPIVARVRGFRF